MAQYTALIAQITAIDRLPLTGRAAEAQLDALAARFTALGTTSVPDRVDGPSYLGRLYSLRLFAAAAADEARSGSPQAAARYSVIRAQTVTLLSLVNLGLGTALALPAAPRPSATTPGTPVSPTSTTSTTSTTTGRR